MGEWHDAIQRGSHGANPSDTKPIGTGLYGSGFESGSGLKKSNINVLALNVRGIMCHGRSEQARLLMIKHKASITVLSETETTHTYAKTTHMEGFRALCPPTTVVMRIVYVTRIILVGDVGRFTCLKCKGCI